MRTLGRFLIGTLASLGFVMLILLTLTIYVVSKFETRTPRTPDSFVLTVDLDRALEETNQRPRLTSLRFGNHTGMQDAILALRRAKDDPRVKAVVATINEQKLGLAQAQEVRDAIATIRAAGKPTMVFSETMGEGGGALQTYYLAAGFETIWVQPSGDVGVAGIGIEQPFLKKTLEKVGLKGAVVKRKEYKSAMENFTDEQISQPNKEALTALVGGWYDQMVEGIAKDRGLDVAAVKALIDKGPLLATEAKDGKLIDNLGYRDQFQDAVKAKVGEIPNVPLRRYVNIEDWKGRGTPSHTIALISAVGEISRGGTDESPFSGDQGIKSAVTAKAIRDAVADKKVEAIVLRIDSPGGSYVASDTIWREVVKAKEKKKPIIASMGNTAASGGYFIAMSADRIFASPATVTGSIGVLTGKVVIGGLAEKLDMHWDRITFGESAGMFSSLTDFNPRELARLNQLMDAIYADFTTKAAQGRGKPVEEFEKFAHGRVWVGSDAVKNGLVDELGGLSEAIDYTKTKIGLKPTDLVNIVAYPEQEDSLDAILKSLSDSDTPTDILSGVRALATLGRFAAPMMEAWQGIHTRGPQLRMEPVEVE